MVATGVGLLVRNTIDDSEVGMTLVGGTINDNGGLLDGSSKSDRLVSDELVGKLVILVVKLVAELDKLVAELETKGVEEMTSLTVAVASMLISSMS